MGALFELFIGVGSIDVLEGVKVNSFVDLLWRMLIQKRFINVKLLKTTTSSVTKVRS